MHEQIGAYPCRFIFVEHANWESIIGNEQDESLEFSERNATNLFAEETRVSFITLNPYANESLRGFLDTRILERTIFIHHPVNGNMAHTRHESHTNILAYGQSVNANLSRIIKAAYRKAFIPEANLLILRRSPIDQMELTYRYPEDWCEVRQHHDGFKKKDMRECMMDADWIMIPYDREQYKVSMSGILADAIRFEIPILGLNSPILNFYNDPPIGITAETPCELGSIIADVKDINDESGYEMFKNNISSLKSRMQSENIRHMKGLLTVDEGKAIPL